MNNADRLISLNRSSVPRYIQLATLFRNRIESGQWAVGAQIPTVNDLADKFGVARATIRQALDIVEKDGLIERFRAKGSFVRSRPNDRLWCEVKTDWSGLLRATSGADIEILSEEISLTAPAQLDHIGEFAPSYLHLRRRHSRSGAAFLLADVYIEGRLSKKIPRSALTSKTAISLVASLPGSKATDLRQTLTVGSADLETADILHIPLNAPVVYVYRSVVNSAGTIIMISKGVYRGDVVRIDMKVK